MFPPKKMSVLSQPAVNIPEPSRAEKSYFIEAFVPSRDFLPNRPSVTLSSPTPIRKLHIRFPNNRFARAGKPARTEGTNATRNTCFGAGERARIRLPIFIAFFPRCRQVRQLLRSSLSCLAARVSRRRMCTSFSRGSFLSEKTKSSSRAREPARFTRSLARSPRVARLHSATVYEISIEFFLDRNVDTLPFPLPLSPFNPSRRPFLSVLPFFSHLATPCLSLSLPLPLALPPLHPFLPTFSVYIPGFLFSLSLSLRHPPSRISGSLAPDHR